MNSPDDLRIAGSKTVANWRALRARLDGNNDAAVWTEALKDFFQARLDSRYFKPIQALEAMRNYDGEGFSIVTLQCSLIEFLASTLEGKSYRYVRKGDPPLGAFEYSRSGDMFTGFLRTHVPFKNIFADVGKARDFYASVRCGLLHEARTKNNWRIMVDKGAKLAIDADVKIVYRNKMRGAFDHFTSWYGAQLLADPVLQAAFLRKFDSLCTE